MKNEMRLQGIGLVEGTPAGELKVGDITRWNNGFIERVTSVEFSKTGKTVIVGIEYMSYSEVPTGKIVQSERKMRVTRLVNIIGGGNTVIVSDTRFEMVEEVVRSEEAPAEEVTIYSKNDVRIVTTPNGEFALTIGQRFNVDYKDEHGEYFIENMLFMGSGPANDCLLFKNDSGDILHMDPLKVQRVTIPFPFKTEREKKLLEAQSKVDRFERYRDILDKSLSRKGLTDEEREEMILLYNELELFDSKNYYILAKAAHMAIQGGAQ
jgi:ribosomal protein S17